MEKRKDIPDNKTGVPLEHYCKLFREQDPAALSEKSGVAYDPEKGGFSLHLLRRPVILTWPEMAVREEGGREYKPNVRMLLGRFVMEGRLSETTGKFLSYTEMPWGQVYAQPFRGRCILRLAFGFGKDVERFRTACRGVGGVEVSAGSADAAFDVEVVDGYTVRLQLWAGDEEIPPSAQILFTDNFPNAFTAEDMAVVGDIVLDEMKAAIS